MGKANKENDNETGKESFIKIERLREVGKEKERDIK